MVMINGVQNRHRALRNFIFVLVLAASFVAAVSAYGDYERGVQAWGSGNISEAISEWMAAAEAEDGRAMLALGRAYRQGLGVLQDYVEAHKWFNLAAARGDADALAEREALAEKMTSQQLAEAQKRAREWQLVGDNSEQESTVATVQSDAEESEPVLEAPPPEAIREAQALLAALGYRPGVADGVWGPRTGQAYANFLRDAGLPESDVLTPQMLRALRSTAAQQGVQADVASAPRSGRQATANLLAAVRAGDIEGLKSALSAGADVNARDGSGLTPLMQAADKGYVLMVEPLLGAPNLDIDARAADGATALFIAAVHKNTEVIDLLVNAGADVSIPGPKGRTAVDLVDVLIKHLRAGNKFRDCDICPKMVVVPAGSFMMGSTDGDSDERPVHRVTISEPFAVGRHEVTFREWDACVSGGGCSHRPDDEGWGRGDRPVIAVNWNDAQEYVRWLSHKTGATYRLLSESEWEYVARAGTTGPYHFGSTISTSQANYDENLGRTAPVGSYAANGFGLHDVHGNAWEWVEDCWHDSYDGAPSDGSAWTSGGDCDGRVLRGGSWDVGPRYLRSANRSRGWVGHRYDYLGFRVARTLVP